VALARPADSFCAAVPSGLESPAQQNDNIYYNKIIMRRRCTTVILLKYFDATKYVCYRDQTGLLKDNIKDKILYNNSYVVVSPK